VPAQADIRLSGHALQCRVTTEDPENNFTPDYGKLTAYRSAAGAGIRLDAGTAYTGAVITPFYDSLLVKVTAAATSPTRHPPHGPRPARVPHPRRVDQPRLPRKPDRPPAVRSGECTTRFIDTTPELFTFKPKRDRASRLLASSATWRSTAIRR
jgi:pyruvate carboxylase